METSLTHLPGALVATIHGVDADGAPLIVWDASPTPRRATRAWSAQEPDWRACLGQRGLIVFEESDVERPVWIAWLEAPRRLAADAALAQPRSLHLSSSEELVLECGAAKIALRADGRVEILGGYLLSRSSGPNKIKGGSVQIN